MFGDVGVEAFGVGVWSFGVKGSVPVNLVIMRVLRV